MKGLTLTAAVCALTAWGVQGANATGMTRTCSPDGEQKTAVILTMQPGVAITPMSADLAQRWILGSGDSVNSYWKAASGGQVWLTGSVFGPYTLDKHYVNADFTINPDIVAAALQAANGQVDASYNHVLVVYQNAQTYGGGVEFGCDVVVAAQQAMDDSRTKVQVGQVGSHEMGHALGLNHARCANYYPEVLGAPGATPAVEGDYCDLFSVMGPAAANGWGHVAAPHKVRMGWLDPVTQVQTVFNSGSFALAPYWPELHQRHPRPESAARPAGQQFVALA